MGYLEIAKAALREIRLKAARGAPDRAESCDISDQSDQTPEPALIAAARRILGATIIAEGTPAEPDIYSECPGCVFCRPPIAKKSKPRNTNPLIGGLHEEP